MTSHESFEIRIQIRTPRRQQNRFHRGAVGQILPQRLKLRVPVHQQMRRVPQEIFVGSSQISADLPNPFPIRIGRNSRDLNSSGLQFHDNQDVHRHESLHRPDFNRGEVNCSERLPVSLQKSFPRGSTTFPFRSRFDTVLFENVSDRLIAHRMLEVRQRPLDPVVSPLRIFPSEPQDQIDDFPSNGRSPHGLLPSMAMPRSSSASGSVS